MGATRDPGQRRCPDVRAHGVDRRDARAAGLVGRTLEPIPIGRFGEPEDVVGAVAFLLGDAASLVTGHTIAVDGGYTIR